LRLRRQLWVGKLGAHDFSFNMRDNLLQESRLLRFGMALAAISFSVFSALGKAIDEPSEQPSGSEESDAIVSEKDEVALVEDSSVREAIERRPDLTFANVTIDGEGSRQSLDDISAESVSSVEVMKAVTPDQDADSRGGSIRLKTRPAYTQEKVVTKVTLESDYQSLVEGLGYEGSVSIGGALNENRTIGGRLTVSYENQHRGTQYINKDWFRRNVGGESKIVLKELRVFDIEEHNTDRDISASLDLKASDSLRFFWKGSHSLYQNQETMPHFEYRFNKGKHVSADENGGRVESAEIERGFYQFKSEYEVAETSIGGEWIQGDLEADFRLMYQDDRFTPLDYLNIDFVMPDADLRYVLDDYTFPTVYTENGTDVNDASGFLLEDFTLRERRRVENDVIGSANFKWKNALGSEKLTLRAGLKSRIRENDTNNNTSYYNSYLGEGEFSLASALSNEPSKDLLSGLYQSGPMADRSQLDSFIETNFDEFGLDERRSRENSDSLSYDVEEQVDAFYVSGDYSVGKWRALVGMRHENTTINFDANEVLLGPDAADKDGDGDLDEIVYIGTNPTSGSSSYGNAFPNAHVRYRWNDRTTFIASYTNTIKRPDYGDVVPYRRVNLEDREVEEGNPGLNPTLYTNVDMSVDFRLGDRGMLSVEVFDRTLDDYIFSNESIIAGGIYDGFELERQENSSSAQLRGVSMTWNQPLHLPLLNDGLSFNANFVRQDSELQYPERPGEVLPLPRLSDNEMNLAFTYEKEKLFAQVKIAAEDDQVYQVAGDAENDRYFAPRGRVDLTLSYKLQKKSRVYVEWDNITNEPYLDIYEGERLYSTYHRLRPWSVTTGLKFEL